MWIVIQNFFQIEVKRRRWLILHLWYFQGPSSQSRSFSTFQETNWATEYNNQRIGKEYREFVPDYTGYSEKFTNYNQSQIGDTSYGDNYSKHPNYSLTAADYGVNSSEYKPVNKGSDFNPRSIDYSNKKSDFHSDNKKASEFTYFKNCEPSPILGLDTRQKTSQFPDRRVEELKGRVDRAHSPSPERRRLNSPLLNRRRDSQSPAPQRKSLEVPPPTVPQWKADFFSTNSLQRTRNKSPYSVRWSSDNQSPQLNRRSIEITSPYLRRKDDNYKDRHSADLNNLQICPEKVDNQTLGRQGINHIQSGALLASLDKSILQIRWVHHHLRFIINANVSN